jgi:hypothetical protein
MDRDTAKTKGDQQLKNLYKLTNSPASRIKTARTKSCTKQGPLGK